jgi:flagellar hook assembly protein FlgD
MRTVARIAGSNPIRDTGVIEYTIGSDVAGAGAAPVSITIHDLAGRLVRTLKEGAEPAGVYRVEWDGGNDSGERVGDGVYFMRFVAGGTTRTAKISVVR